jgi:hypothetical protein
MLCSQLHLVKYEDGYRDVKPLPCNSWSCDYCAPRRKSRLMAQAASGEPNRCLTLTITSRVGISPANRYHMLHDAWRIVAKRIVRQFALPPERRWIITNADDSKYQNPETYKRTKGIKTAEYSKLHYFAFVEATKRGEPHLHILVRSPYIPQDWLARQMEELIQSPRVWIDRIKNTKAAVGYVSKYVTKAPAQFGKTRRYWSTRGWEVNKSDRPEYDRRQYQGARIVVKRWREVIDEIDIQGLIVVPRADGWLRLHTIRSMRTEYGDPDEDHTIPAVFAAFAYRQAVRDQLARPTWCG